MLLRFWIAVLLCHTEVDNMDNASAFASWSADQKIIGLNIAINEILFMDSLNPRQLWDCQYRTVYFKFFFYHLLRYHYNSLNRKSSVAVIEKILKAGAQQVND